MKTDREKALEMLEKVSRDYKNAMAHLTGAEPAYALLANVRSDLDRTLSLLKSST